MNWTTISALVFGFAVSILGCAETATLPQGKSISLTDIWAFDMPGTRDVGELEPETYGRKALTSISTDERDKRFNASLIKQIAEQLEFLNENELAGEGFAVVGTGHDALQNAHAVLVKDNNRQQSFRPDDEIMYSSRFLGIAMGETSLVKWG